MKPTMPKVIVATTFAACLPAAAAATSSVAGKEIPLPKGANARATDATANARSRNCRVFMNFPSCPATVPRKGRRGHRSDPSRAAFLRASTGDLARGLVEEGFELVRLARLERVVA